ncbi:MAG: acyl carrier protein [Thermodesulfobacteriota bacterium]
MSQKLTNLLAELFEMKAEDITDKLTMEDVDLWDSLKHMELIVSIEQAFGIELTFDEISNMQNVKKIKGILLEKGVTD